MLFRSKYDPGFGKEVTWDIPLLEEYDFQFVRNTSRKPGSHHFFGIINPTLNNEIENWNADAILVYGWNFSSHVKAISYFHGKKPVYFRGDSIVEDNHLNPVKSIFKKFALKWLYSKIDAAFYVGKLNQKYFKKYGVKEDKLIFAPHAVENDRFDKIGRAHV